jgi:hypothetical protein
MLYLPLLFLLDLEGWGTQQKKTISDSTTPTMDWKGGQGEGLSRAQLRNKLCVPNSCLQGGNGSPRSPSLGVGI